MQTQKLQKRIQNSYSKFLHEYISGNKMSLVFSVPKISVRGNENIIDKFQIELGKLSQKNIGFKLNTIQTIKGTIIDSIEFQDSFSYLKFIGKTNDFNIFCKNLEILKNFKFLDDWVKLNYKIINEYTGKWQDILKVVKYFLINPKKNLFTRELEIDVDTKFIEKNKNIIDDLLVFIDYQQDGVFSFVGKNFEEKFGLKLKPIFVRFRFLDTNLKDDFLGTYIDDIYIKIGDFYNIKTSFEKVFIVENEINYLTFPSVENSIIIWGKGFNISILKNILWLKEKEIYYFGDLDSHGFKILAQCRKYFPITKSIFMNSEIFNLYSDFIGKGQKISEEEVSKLGQYLENEEFELLKHINQNNLRLEQENIRQSFIIKNIGLIDKKV